MNSLISRVCALIVTAVSLIGGCNMDSPQKTESIQNQDAPRTVALKERKHAGEELFKQFCSPCHPDGGNVTDPRRSLRSSALKKNHITRPEDIVKVMRHPISRMIRFDETAITNKEAMEIAEYILKTFK